MDNNVLEIKPVSLGPWITLEYRHKRKSRVVKPVGKAEKSVLGGVRRESESQYSEPTPVTGPEWTRGLVGSVQSYLADLNSSLSFEVHEHAGELTVQLINRDTREVIRQIFPEELLQLNDKLEELRGVLFDGEA
jgi:flagellar protein FlaG